MTKISNYVRPGAAAKTWPSTPGSSSTLNPLTAKLDDLSDVDTTGVGDGDALIYDAGSSTWIPGAGGGGNRTQVIAASGASQTLDLGAYDVFDITLTANCTLTFSNVPAAAPDISAWTFIVRQGGTGSYAITWPAAVSWPDTDGTPTSTAPDLWTAVDAVDLVTLLTGDDGTTYGADLFPHPASGVAGGTPALTFGTTNSAGAAGTAVLTDATIALFDATAPTTAAYDDTAATGSAGTAARRDHRHGMPSAGGGGIGPILISDTPSTPLVFADLLQNEAQDDLVYADP